MTGRGATGSCRPDASGRRALSTERHPETWLRKVAANGNGVVEDTLLGGEEAARECLLMGMRTSHGVSLERLQRLGGAGIDRKQLDHLVSDGLVRLAGGGDRLAATATGRQVLNSVIEHIAVRTMR